MAIQFPDLSPGGPSATSNIKNRNVKVIKLTPTDFTTGGAAAVKAVLAGDATITGLSYWKKTAFAGGGVTAVTFSLGITGTPTHFVSAFDVHTPVAGTQAPFTPITNIMQPYAMPPSATDISLLFTGTATTGNPTSGEIYIIVEYVR